MNNISLAVTPMTPAVEQRPVILSAENVTVAFPSEQGDIEVLRNFSLSIREGEFVGLMGEPGCGKSTAAAALLGAARSPGRIKHGSVKVFGTDVTAMSEAELRKLRGGEAAMIMQNPRYALHPMLSVGQQIVTVYRSHNPASKKEAWAHAVQMLRKVGINDPERRAHSLPHELSSGMAQRVLIAIALSSNPRLLIADEPTSGLDVTVQAQILDDMWENCRSSGAGVLIVTQDLGIVANYCDRVLMMKDGAIVEDAPTEEFFRAPKHPYSRAILALQREAESGGISAPRIEGSAPLISVRNLTKLYDIRNSASKVHAIEGLDFEIGRGECVGLVGESGSGKTTAGRCVLRLVPPTRGTISYNGTDLSKISEDDFRSYRNKLQIVFQDPLDSLDPRQTVGEAIREPLDMHMKMSKPDSKARVAELLRLVGLDAGMTERMPRELSAGQQQRVVIARAIACDPEFLVLDEPTSSLTPETTAEIVKLLVDLSARFGLAYLFISHDLTTIKYVCHRVVVMYLGQVVESGTVRQIFEDAKHPYSTSLLASHLFPDTAHRRVDRTDRISLKGEIPSPVTENLPKGCYLYGRCPMQEERCRLEPQPLRQLADQRWVRCWRAS